VGFPAANNVVLRQTRAPYVLLLNPDTEVSEGALDGALAALRADAQAADSLVYVVLAGKLLVSITRSAIARRGFR